MDLSVCKGQPCNGQPSCSHERRFPGKLTLPPSYQILTNTSPLLDTPEDCSLNLGKQEADLLAERYPINRE